MSRLFDVKVTVPFVAKLVSRFDGAEYANVGANIVAVTTSQRITTIDTGVGIILACKAAGKREFWV